MIVCKVSCPLYNSCKERAEWKRCIFDYGIKTDNEDGDDFLEKFTY